MGNDVAEQTELELLNEKLEAIKEQYAKAQEALKVSQRRYDIAVGFSDVTIFDYNIKTRKILTQPEDFEIYGMPGVLENGVEEVIDAGIIAQRSKEEIRRLYREIDNGAATASATIYANDLNGGERTLLIQMVSIFDQQGKPAHAVGVRKDITDFVRYRKEMEYNNLLASELTFIYEANVSRDKILRYDSHWAQEIALGDIATLTGVLKLMCERYIAIEDVENFMERQSPKSLLAAFQKGERVVTFEYRKWVVDQGYEWFEVRINLIQEEVSKDINMRVYILNINNRKKNEMQAVAEHKRYELALAKSVIIYELNITKDTMNYVRENVSEQFDLFYGEHFTQQVLPCILRATYPQEKKVVAELLSRTNLLNAYASGKTDLDCEYRRVNKHGQYNWFRCSLRLFEDIQNKDILGYAYIEDINAEKEKELTLLYKAQHDLMTGFLNKNAITEKIDTILCSEEGQRQTHIFFIIDLDYFKLVNDKFGHAFGDAVLSQISAKIKASFRSGDLLGRIGGDEFVAFMKDVPNEEVATLKAKELCENVPEIYMQGGEEYKVTVSVGIAISGSHGGSYEELYHHSDTALYEAKEQGRDRFSIYREDMRLGGSAVNGIDQRQVVETQTFESSVNDYILRILYEAQDKPQAIRSVLELVGKHYQVSRAYVFENSEDNAYTSNTFEWCNQGVASQMAKLQRLAYKEVGDYQANFSKEGVFYLADSSTVASPLRGTLEAQNIKSMLQFSILKKGKFAGFVGFDECSAFRVPDSRELNNYRNFSNLLGLFITEMRAFERVEAMQDMALSVVNGLDSYAYVCDPFTYEILFANVNALKSMPNAKSGGCCYKELRGFSAPCEDCPMQQLKEGKQDKNTRLLYREASGDWLKITTSWVDWLKGQKACLVDIADITELKK